MLTEILVLLKNQASLDGQSIEDTILIYPKGSGSTVAPFVLMGLIYTGKGPKAIINNDVCPLTLPACSLLNLSLCLRYV